MNMRRTSTFAICLLLFACFAAPASAVGTRIRNICRVKGQEENTLRGYGLVVGLKGTGEAGDVQTMKALARSMELMGSPLGQEGPLDAKMLDNLKKNKNIAMAMVTAIVPPTGARRGDKVDCHVSGITGKSLAGGRLAFAALQGPNTQDNRIYALAQGTIHIEDDSAPLSGKINHGCQIEQDIFNPFELDGQITLLLDHYHANFDTANDIAETIRDNSRFSNEDEDFVQAIDAKNIIVHIPKNYPDGKVAFVSEILGMQILAPTPEARVVINERTGSIVISGDVEIGSVIVTHKNLVVEAGLPPAKFVDVDTTETNPAKLQALLTALNALKVPANDIIEIIKGIDCTGKLHGRLIIE